MWGTSCSDVTVPDGTKFNPNTAFTKTWRLKNVGTCTWTTSYAAVFDSGSQMSAPAVVSLTQNVPPGGTVDISVPMTAPATNGIYRGDWKLRNASGVIFGLGSTASKTFYVTIEVGNTDPVHGLQLCQIIIARRSGQAERGYCPVPARPATATDLS